MCEHVWQQRWHQALKQIHMMQARLAVSQAALGGAAAKALVKQAAITFDRGGLPGWRAPT